MFLNENQKEMYKDCMFLTEGLFSNGNKFFSSVSSELREVINMNKSKYKDLFIHIRTLEGGAGSRKITTQMMVYGIKSLPLAKYSFGLPENQKKVDNLFEKEYKHIGIHPSNLDKDVREYASKKKYDSLFEK